MNFNKLYSEYKTATWKNLKFWYYLKNYIRLYLPKRYFEGRLKQKLSRLKKTDQAAILERVNYYNKISASYSLVGGNSLSEFNFLPKFKNYYFDTYEISRHFKNEYKIAHEFGDNILIPGEPAIVKSRPIQGNNQNAVVLKLDKVRHFLFVNDKKPFQEKQTKILWRGNVYEHQPNRLALIEHYKNHPFCDIGQVNQHPKGYPAAQKLNLYEHLDYQFIVSLEGNDVATNLKWIMSSNSIAVSPKLKYETWFMEGKLIPDVHYIQVKDDYSDLIEKCMYYANHPEEAQKIIDQANEYVTQFKNKQREELISLLVLKKYFDLQKKTPL